MHFAISPFNNRLLNANLLVCSAQQDSKSSSSCTKKKKTGSAGSSLWKSKYVG